MFDLEKLKTLPVLQLPGTKSSEVTGLSISQIFFNNHFDFLQSFWWVAYFIVAMIVLYQFIKARSYVDLPIEIKQSQNIKKFQEKYKKLFSLGEIKNSIPLRLMGGAILIGYAINFYFLVSNSEGTIQSVENGLNVCWPFFQSCNDFIFLEGYPDSHMQRVIYGILFFVMLTAARKLLENRIVAAHVCILILFLWHLYVTAISYSQYMHVAAYTYYILAFSFIFVFCAYKRFFFCISFIFFYFLSVPTKLSDTWIVGTYFSATAGKAPFLSNEVLPFITNLVIFIQIFAPWFLISARPKLQKTAFYIFSMFHFYATFIVLYHYSIVAIPAFLILFGVLFKPFEAIPKNFKSLTGWSLITFLCLIQSVPHIISNDRWITLEGGLYGMYMIEANHQCDVKIIDGYSGDIVQHIQSATSSYRCDPYHYFKIAQQNFCNGDVGAVYRMEFLHSLNGGPFYMIVDEDNVCDLEYKPFSHNEWIKTRETAPALFRPTKN